LSIVSGGGEREMRAPISAQGRRAAHGGRSRRRAGPTSG